MTEPIRVLQVVASLNAGGMENYIMNLYRMVDKSKVQFDFVVHHAAVGLYEDEIHELGGKIYHFTVLDDKNVVKYISELNRFFDEHSVASRNSCWVKYELNYADQQGKEILILSKDSIDSDNICLTTLKDKWFTDSNYESILQL